jgi:hypothetical protein
VDLRTRLFEATGLDPEMARKQASSERFIEGDMRRLGLLQQEFNRTSADQQTRGVAPHIQAGLALRGREISDQLTQYQTQRAMMREVQARPVQQERERAALAAAGTDLLSAQATEARRRGAGLILNPISEAVAAGFGYLGTRETAKAQERTAQAVIGQQEVVNQREQQKVNISQQNADTRLDQLRTYSHRYRGTRPVQVQADMDAIQRRINSLQAALTSPNTGSTQAQGYQLRIDELLTQWEELSRQEIDSRGTPELDMSETDDEGVSAPSPRGKPSLF